jgi:cell wall-associated NlpC family hydrolase
VEPGDLLLVKTNHLVSRLIRFGQRGYGEPYASWNHVAIFVGDGHIVEALTKGVVLSPADKYPDTQIVEVKAPGLATAGCEKAMRVNAVSFARSCVGESYGWLTIAAIALKVLFRGRWQFGVQGTEICSGLCARALERLGYDFNPYDPAELTPAFLAKELT